MTVIDPEIGASPDQSGAKIIDLQEHLQSNGGVLNFLRHARHVGQSTVESVLQLPHELMHGNFSEKFKREFDEGRVELECQDGMPKTARVFNGEYLHNDKPAIIYTYSLAVPGAHGIELSTLADIAGLGEKTGQAVIAITTDGQAGKTTWEQKWQMTDFWNHVGHNWDVLRYLLPHGKHLTITGSSFGGMMAFGMAETAEEESLRSGHRLHVDHIIPVASAGHGDYGLKDRLAAGKQFTYGEGRSAISYVRQGRGWRQKIQRSFELVGTAPRHLDQVGAIACTALGIMKSPLKGSFRDIPWETRVFDITFSQDGVTQPDKRSALWAASGHPNAEHVPEDGNHLDLLTRGRELTLMYLWEVAPPHPRGLEIPA